VIAAALAAWSFVVQGEPAALHECAMHDGVGHGPALVGVAHTASADATEHHAAGTAQESTGDGDRGPHSRGCTCPGPCCDESPIALIAASVPLVAPATRPATQTAVRHTTHVPSEAEHSRPPSIGPPAPHIG